ncbi:hypothetical protein OED01_14680 [Microbacterium sp. M28]|uniref:hypothetical protein n=1 Tax=Microbacterium sp. M28 TaxID=2962064 RepID=UPI0021F44837|nr:hypothetical protein [Microbacterium sp. M28]UYO96827.1 hypothetical protein OED01_14680 [Microbacterium sp. M28]
MYEHPSLTISAMLHEQEMLNRAVERRRAILERLETRSVPRRSWFERVTAAFRGTRATAAGHPGTVAEASEGPAAMPSATASDRVVSGILDDRAPVDASVLLVPTR